MIEAIVFDTGALIALERRRLNARQIHQTALRARIDVVVPSVVVAEWWRRGKREKERATLLRSVIVAAPTDHVARAAGEAIGIVGGIVVDAIVMAVASLRGGIVYTSDVDDLTRLTEVFRDVRVEAI